MLNRSKQVERTMSIRMINQILSLNKTIHILVIYRENQRNQKGNKTEQVWNKLSFNQTQSTTNDAQVTRQNDEK